MLITLYYDVEEDIIIILFEEMKKMGHLLQILMNINLPTGWIWQHILFLVLGYQVLT